MKQSSRAVGLHGWRLALVTFVVLALGPGGTPEAAEAQGGGTGGWPPYIDASRSNQRLVLVSSGGASLRP